MRITIVQTSIVIDIPEEVAQPAPKPPHPFTLLERLLRRATEAEHDSTPKPPTQERFNGTFLT